jgi:hypothetical protein
MGVRVCECLRVLDCNDADEEWSISIRSTRAADDTASNNALCLRRYDLLCLDIVRSKATRLKICTLPFWQMLVGCHRAPRSSQDCQTLHFVAIEDLCLLCYTTQESRILRQSVEFEELFRAILAMPIGSCQKQNRIKKKQQTQIIHYRYPEIKYSNIKLQRREKRNSSPRLAISICSFCLCYFFERIFC